MVDQAAQSRDPIAIVYDGECPFCANYVKLVKLREAVGPVRLIDARSDDPIVKRLTDAGYDLNEGMAMVDGEKIWHGDECVNRIALMSTSSGLFNRINAGLFRSQGASRLLYPWLRGGRNFALKALGRKPIQQPR
ncbi:MAG TPA: DCC1-like thiol-disulfide oxidoreductase family protein [Hyphomonadaceae bacterium]|jgi:predicted DCC family thiol-disulfide oxidoreductase YuxK|nr:DCC1-like thiol-disulfide oxidoreductase family protein [Hyphomonadaceae bacterium]